MKRFSRCTTLLQLLLLVALLLTVSTVHAEEWDDEFLLEEEEGTDSENEIKDIGMAIGLEDQVYEIAYEEEVEEDDNNNNQYNGNNEEKNGMQDVFGKSMDACFGTNDFATELVTAVEERNFEYLTDNPSKILSLMDNVSEISCLGKREQEFRSALAAFETCAGFDLVKVIEVAPNAILGLEMECATSVLRQVKDGISTISPDFILSNECATALFGDNVFGNFLSSLFLYPDKMTQCFDGLHSLPDCTLQVWPIPLVGSWLRGASCVLFDLIRAWLIETYAAQEVIILQDCIPTTGSTTDYCKAALEKCRDAGSVLFSMPQPLTGPPLSDACVRLAETTDMQNTNAVPLAERYDRMRLDCVNVWPAWEDVDDGDDTMSLQDEISAEGFVEDEEIVEIIDVVEVTVDVQENESAPPAPVMFLSGIGCSFAVIGFLWGMLSLKQRQVREQELEFEFTEMGESDLALS